MTTTTDVAVRESAVITPAERASAATALAESGSIHSWLVVMRDVTLLAEHIADTQFVPKAIRGNPAAVAAAILAGMELGLPPMTALRHVQVVEGSPGLSAEYKRARVLAAGHKLDITEHTTEACTVTGHRKGHESVTVRFTMADARRAGLVDSKPGHGPRPYVTRPRRMLFARACTEVCDALFADLTNGLPTTELLEEEAELSLTEAEPVQQHPRVSAEQARARGPRQTVVATAEPVTPDVPPAETAPPSPPAGQRAAGGTAAGGGNSPSPASSGQRSQIMAQFKRLGTDPATEEGWTTALRAVARIIGIAAIADLAELTSDEAVTVLAELKKLDSRELARLTADEDGVTGAAGKAARDGE